MERSLPEAVLNPVQAQVIVEVGHGENVASRIAKKRDLQYSHVSKSVDKLEEDGYLNREEDESDQRLYRLVLTQKGETWAEHLKTLENLSRAEAEGIPR